MLERFQKYRFFLNQNPQGGGYAFSTQKKPYLRAFCNSLEFSFLFRNSPYSELLFKDWDSTFISASDLGSGSSKT
jgi:hypothetical protein